MNWKKYQYQRVDDHTGADRALKLFAEMMIKKIRKHLRGLVRTQVHGKDIAMAPQSRRPRVQRYKRFHACVQNGRIVNISMARD